jgi:hypothetical protein
MVEGELVALAQRNPSKFQRLNQRLQPQQGGGAGAGGHGTGTADHAAAGGQAGSGRQAQARMIMPDRTNHVAAAGGPRQQQQHLTLMGHTGPTSGSGSMMGASARPPASTAAGPGPLQAAAGGGPGACHGPGDLPAAPAGGRSSDTWAPHARMADVLALASAFPPAQRPYVLFLELADSAQLAGALAASLARRLAGLVGGVLGAAAHGGAPSVGPIGEHAITASTLALFLGEQGGGGGGPGGNTLGATPLGQHLWGPQGNRARASEGCWWAKPCRHHQYHAYAAVRAAGEGHCVATGICS